MGREIKRVAENFEWPLGQVWHGFIRPENSGPIKCSCCNGQGYNDETRKIADQFYDSNNFGVTWSYEYNVDPQGNPATRPPWNILGNTQRWCNSITQDEVEALVEAGRLYDFTHTWSKEKGWVRREDGYMPTAQEVNNWNQNGMGHDGSNRCILIKVRAERLGVYGYCDNCHGEGSYFENRYKEEAYDSWKETDIPTGSWWQVWENVSEGSPVTPAFATQEELIEYLVKYGDKWDQGRGDGGWNREAAVKFVGLEYMPSMILSNGQIITSRNMDQMD